MRSFRKNLTKAAVVAAGATSLMMVGATAASAQPAVSVSPANGTDATHTVTIKIPSGATCSGDNTGGANQYQIYPYVTQADPKTIRLTAGAITPSSAWFINDTATAFAPFVPGAGNHSVSQPANFDPASYALAVNGPDYGVAGADLQPGTWNIGVMCIDGNTTQNPTGAPDIPGNGDPTQNNSENFWNTQFTFTNTGTNSPNPIDFSFVATTGAGNVTPEAPLAIALPLSFLGLAGAGTLVLRRRRHRAAITA
jgi:hypothetical protein